MSYYHEDAISRLNQVREETLTEMLSRETYSDEWEELWEIEHALRRLITRLKINQSRQPAPLPEPPHDPPKQYLCPHDYNLQREYCPMGCTL